VLIDYTLQ